MAHSAIEKGRRLFEEDDLEGAASVLAEADVEADSDDDADRAELIGRIATAQQRRVEAVQHLERALAIRQRRHGKTSAQAASGHAALGRHYLFTGEHAVGLAAAKLAVKRSGDPAWLVLKADLERSAGDASAAEKTYVAALAKLRGEARIPALRGLGNVHLLQGNGKKAKQRFVQARALVEDEASYDAAVLESALGQAATALRNSAAAVRHFERALELLIACVGETHWDVSICLANLGFAAHESDAWKAAAATQYAIALDQRTNRTEHPFHAAALNNLAYYCSKVGKPLAAFAYAERALALLERTRPLWHLDVALTLSNLANYHRAAGRDDLAIGRALQLAEIASELVATGQEAAAGILFSTGTLVLELGKDPAKALALYTAALTLREQLRGAEDDSVTHTAFNATARLFVAGATAEAIAILEGAKTRWTDEENLELVDETIDAVRTGDGETVLQGTELDESDDDD